MAYPIVAGMTSMSGSYIPIIWSGKTLVKFYTATVFGAICNTDYEGEIKSRGDTVRIRTVPDMVIRDYVIDQNLVYDRPTPGYVDLLIDKGKYYALSINEVERLQADIPYVEKWTDDAGQQLAITIDSSILAAVYAYAATYNKGLTAGYRSGSVNIGTTGTPLQVDKTNILDTIVDCGTCLDEYDVPFTKRWMVLSAIFCGMIKKSDLKDASLAGDGTSIMRNGRLGMIDRYEIFASNQIATSTDGVNTVHNCIFGHPSAITFASQLTKTETLKNPNDFGDLMRGLQVYGWKVIKEPALGHLYIYK
jgi:hypothetical protein